MAARPAKSSFQVLKPLMCISTTNLVLLTDRAQALDELRLQVKGLCRIVEASFVLPARRGHLLGQLRHVRLTSRQQPVMGLNLGVELTDPLEQTLPFSPVDEEFGVRLGVGDEDIA